MEKSVVTKICIMDFDGTLVLSPLPTEGKALWEKKTGKIWPYNGWWSKPESLDTSVFDIKGVYEVVSAYKKLADDPQTYMVLLTGRLPKLSGLVKEILDSLGLKFDEYLFNNKSDTLHFKLGELGRLITQFPNVEVISMWDDRDEHIPYFEEWGQTMERVKKEQGKPFRFVMHHVISNNHE